MIIGIILTDEICDLRCFLIQLNTDTKIYIKISFILLGTPPHHHHNTHTHIKPFIVLNFILLSTVFFYSSLSLRGRSSFLVFSSESSGWLPCYNQKESVSGCCGEGELAGHGVTRVEKHQLLLFSKYYYLPIISTPVLLAYQDLNWSKRSACMESFLVEMLRLHLAAFTSLLRSSAEKCWHVCSPFVWR